MTVRRRSPLSATATTATLFGALALWLVWPLLRPAVAPAHGGTLVVVFDGYHRLDVALAQTSGPLLLLSCPLTGQPTPDQRRRAGARPLHIDRSGQDSVRQLTALAAWLERPPRNLAPFGRVLLVSDSHHLPRLRPAARLALGGQGLTVSSLAADAHWPPSQRQPHPGPWPILRDWWRLQLWRATGSTGAFLAPSVQRRKSLVCSGL